MVALREESRGGAGVLGERGGARESEREGPGGSRASPGADRLEGEAASTKQEVESSGACAGDTASSSWQELGDDLQKARWAGPHSWAGNR